MTQAFKVNQFHYGASAGDAVTNHMFLIQKALHEAGTRGSIFSVEIKNLPNQSVLPFKRERIWDCDLLLVHHSHGNPALKQVLGIEIPKVLIYHNVTPPSFYTHDPLIFDLCKKGRSQLNEMKRSVVEAFADSRYNAKELTQIGYKTVDLLPLLDLNSLEIPEVRLESPDPKAPRNLLFVGRLAPHKNQRLLIEAFFYLKMKWPKHSRLTLVGGGDPVYTRYLKLLTRQLGISQSVQFTGHVTDEELGHLYEMSDAFVCTSLHEGFCVPLVEAMKHGVPIFYLPEGAIPETMGNAGLRFETRSPVAISEILFHALNHQKLIHQILRSQQVRLAELKESQTAEKIRGKLLPLLQTLETRHFPHVKPVEMHAE